MRRAPVLSKTRQLPNVVNRSTWQRLMEVGHAFDINKGGLFDASSGCINFWCSPEDKPACWKAEITKEGLDYPREYVGTIYFEWKDDDQVGMYLEASPYQLKDKREGVSDDKLESCLDWLQQKFQDLLRLTELQPEITGTKCPFCTYVLPNGELLNGLLDHITLDHRDVQLQGVTMGRPWVVHTNKGQYPLEAAERFS